MALKKNSPYKKFFDKGIQNMVDNGQLKLYKQRNTELTIDCKKPPDEGNPFDFLKTASIFIILSFGVLLSTLFLLYECLKRPKNFVNSLSEEKITLFYSQFTAMFEKFEITDIQALRIICQDSDSSLCGACGHVTNKK